VSRAFLWLASGLLAGACAPRHPAPAAPAPRPLPAAAVLRFEVIGGASPADTGPPTLRLDSQVVTIRGMAIQPEGGGLYADVDLSQPHTVRLTLYDSLPGRPIQEPVQPSRYDRQVVWQARIGPLAPGPYDVWLGRFDPRSRTIEVFQEPLHIEVARAAAADSTAKRE
jgi:hypothetical protein